MKLSLNRNWEYTDVFDDAFLKGEKAGEIVQIPHTTAEVPLHYANEMSYQKICGYRKNVMFTKQQEGKRQFLVLDGAAHIAEVYLNGQLIGKHACGYTAYRVELTPYVKYGEENTIVVRLDSTENASIPPFGHVIDYLTYGGLYRSVWLEEREQTHIEDVFVTTPALNVVNLQVRYSGKNTGDSVQIQIFDENGSVVDCKKKTAKSYEFTCVGVTPWSIETPHLYTCVLTLENGDVYKTRFGFRTIRIDENHFYLNDQEVFLRGLNRHQSFPYVGYAATDSLHVEDARILKEELGVNAVRTSHYPQSQSFIDACDEKGLLVFTEIPGWQHIGDAAWKRQAVENAKEMVLQYRNHPSIVLWGVRINESLDDDAFYRQTNDIVHSLDATRPTTGVRYLEKSSLLEDVYSYNDFSHMGSNPGAKKKKDVTPDMKKPLLISEANGHMFPTKSSDRMERRQEHALRHARVLQDALKDHEHMGAFQWCMFDYATHKDFGSGDRVCYHGVLDQFRNPKMAASVYASQSDERPVLEVGSSMDIGDYDGGHLDSFYAFTNADEVRLYKNDVFVKSFTANPAFGAMKHGPVKIDDTIGDLLKSQEGFSGKKESLIHEAMLSAQQYGFSAMPKKDLAKLGFVMIRYGLKYEDGVALYGKYVGGWGGDAVAWRFDALINGEVVKSVVKKQNADLHLDADISNSTLKETITYDMAAIRFRLLDGYDNLVSYAQLPVKLHAEGPVEIVGPDVVTLEGGMAGTYIKTTGKAGTAVITISCDQCEDVSIPVTIEIKEEA